MKHRTFGVEIECGHPEGYGFVSNLLYNEGLDGWDVGMDGSGVEARSPILRGPTGFKTLRRAMNVIRENGGVVTAADGLHVHHGVPDLEDDKDAIVRLVRSWMDNTPLIHQFVAERRRDRGPCPDWLDVQFAQLVENGTVDSGYYPSWDYARNRYQGEVYVGQCGPRGSLNLWSLSEHGTVELRSHEGTLDADIAEAWVRFGQRFINAVVSRKTPMPRCNSHEELLKRVRLGKTVAKRLIEKPVDLTYMEYQEFRAMCGDREYYDDDYDGDGDW